MWDLPTPFPCSWLNEVSISIPFNGGKNIKKKRQSPSEEDRLEGELIRAVPCPPHGTAPCSPE